MPKDGGADPAPQAAHSSAVEPKTGLTFVEACNLVPSNSYPVVGPGPHTLEPAEPGWAPVMEFTAADIFQHSPFGDMLNSLKSLSLSGGSEPNYVWPEWEAGDEGIRCPPTTHFVAMIDDLTDLLDFDFKDIDGMDDDAGDIQEPPLIGRWTATSSNDIYMVDTPKETNGDEAVEDNPREAKQNMGVFDATPSPATSIPVPEMIRIVLKRNTVLISRQSSRPYSPRWHTWRGTTIHPLRRRGKPRQ